MHVLVPGFLGSWLVISEYGCVLSISSRAVGDVQPSLPAGGEDMDEGGGG